VLHYSACVRHLRILATELGRLAWPIDEATHDKPRPISAELLELAGEMERVVGRYSAAGVPLWPPVASSAYASFLLGELGPEFFSLTWDASRHGWAALLRWWAEGPGGRSLRERLLIGSWPDGEDVSEQPYRECLAAPLALEAAARVLDLRSRIGLLCNDAEAAIAALAGPKAESLNAVLDGWRARLAGMAQRGVALERATLTAAFGRAFGYYDGYLFEIRSASLGDERPVAAGGRYDGLPLKLGIGKLGVATDTGAVGFMIRPARAYAGGGE
jgi:hypothetical protein